MRWVGVGVVIAAVVAIWWFTRGESKPARPVATRSGKITLDVAAFRRLRDARVSRAKQLANEHPRKRAGSGSGLANVPLIRDFAQDQCGIGPASLCDVLGDLLVDCDAGDGTACHAIGQFLVDNPPRALISTLFFGKACDLGEREACAYMKKVENAATARCSDDAFICGWKAVRTHELATYEESCAMGVADSCSAVSFFGGDKLDDPAKSQTYLEKACQLGLPMACQALADRLSASCEPREIGDDQVTPCYPVDEALAAEARAIGCEAGWGDGCKYNDPP